jgi:hypothetical protein
VGEWGGWVGGWVGRWVWKECSGGMQFMMATVAHALACTALAFSQPAIVFGDHSR